MPLIPGDAGCTVGLSSELHTAILAGACGAVDGTALKALCYAIATAVCSHVTMNGTVIPTALIAPLGGGAVTGTGTIT